MDNELENLIDSMDIFILSEEENAIESVALLSTSSAEIM